MSQGDTELLLINAHKNGEIHSAIVLNGIIILQTEAETIGPEFIEKTLVSLQTALDLQDSRKIDFHMHSDVIVWSDILNNLATFGKIKRIKVHLSEFQVTIMDLLRSLSNEVDSLVNLYSSKKGLKNFKSVSGKEIESITLKEIESCSLVECIHINVRDSFSDKTELNIDTIFPADEVIKTNRNF